jgi:hypothetical protein
MLTTKEYLIQINQKLEDFIENYKENRQEHQREHRIIWKFIIGIPSFLVIVFTLIKLVWG